MPEHAFLNDAGTAPLQILTFTLNRIGARPALFGVELSQIREVARAPLITPIPGAAPHVRGIVSLRDELMRVVDLSSAMLGQAHPDGESYLIVTDTHGRQQAFLVSGIAAILRIKPSEIRQLDERSTAGSGLIAGVVMAEKLVTLLDLEALHLEEDPSATLARIEALQEQAAL